MPIDYKFYHIFFPSQHRNNNSLNDRPSPIHYHNALRRMKCLLTINFIIFFSHHSIEKILKDFADVANTPVFSAINDMRKMESDFEEFQSDPNFSNTRNIKGKIW